MNPYKVVYRWCMAVAVLATVFSIQTLQAHPYASGVTNVSGNINFILNYPQKVNVSFEATITDMIPRESADIVFFGEKGRLNIFRSGYRFLPAGGDDPLVAKGGPEPAHMGNFLDCVRSRKQPNANAVDGHYGAMACHVGNIAYRTGQAVAWKKEWDA